jgi:hypothetical protein
MKGAQRGGKKKVFSLASAGMRDSLGEAHGVGHEKWLRRGL